jgi:hypothetical protein
LGVEAPSVSRCVPLPQSRKQGKKRFPSPFSLGFLFSCFFWLCWIFACFAFLFWILHLGGYLTKPNLTKLNQTKPNHQSINEELLATGVTGLVWFGLV